MQINDKRLDFASRRTLLLGAASLLLSGCANSPSVFNALKAARYTFSGLPDKPVTRKQVSNIPYATISAKIGRGPRSILVLDRKTKEDYHWISADRAVIVTRNGRIVKTYGFPENIKQTQLSGADPVNRTLHELTTDRTSSRTIDTDSGNRFGLKVDSRFELLGPREINIAEIDIKTVLVKEVNTSSTINWSFTNYYWVDAFDGFVWKSTQHIARSFPPVDIEVLKPPV